MLTEKRKDGSHVSVNVPVNAEQVSQREVSPLVAVPPCEEKIRDAGRLAGVGARKVYQAVKRGLQLGVSENFYIHRFGSFGPCIKKIECRQFLGSIVFRGPRQFVEAPSDIFREHCEVGKVAILNLFLDADQAEAFRSLRVGFGWRRYRR